MVITPGHMTGTMTWRNAWNRVQPSTMALSSRSLGMLRKKEWSIQRVNGWLMATSTTMVVGIWPHRFHSKKGRR